MKVLIIAIIGWACHLVAAQEKVCSTFCSSLGMLQSNPGKSCDDIYQINKASRGVSGNYWINTTTGVHQVYCDMELECGGHKGGWMRIADLDTSRGDDCPSGWGRITSPVVVCAATISSGGCYSANFPTLNTPYSKVCGMAVGYQSRTTDGFRFQSINAPYVEGLSITYGNPRKHIWTYAIHNCPCFDNPSGSPPPFVHDNYYCESGSLQNPVAPVAGIYINDPVWDGENCSGEDSCCSEPSQPWFYRQIPLTTSEDIEARICRDEDISNEDVLIRELQLYVQ